MKVGDKLGDGGTATVFRATVPVHGDVAFKEYRTGHGVDADVRPDDDSVADLIDVVAGMGSAERAPWLERFAWPLSVVTSGDAVVGNLMPMAPERFYVDYTTGSGARQRTKRRFADMQLLLNSPDFLANRGIAVTRLQRLGLLRSAAEGFAKLHARGIVAGDVSAKNLAFDVSGAESAVYFIDCDAMTRIGSSGDGRHVETADWTVPVAADGSREPLNTVTTDAYKFGLLVVRLLAGRQEARDPSALPEDASILAPLLTRALSTDPSVRPRPADWGPSLTMAMRREAKPAANRTRPHADRTVAAVLPPMSDAAERDRQITESVLRSPPPHINDGQVIRRFNGDYRDPAANVAWRQRMTALTDSAANGLWVSGPIDYDIDDVGAWGLYKRDHVRSYEQTDLVTRERRRLVGRLAQVLDQAAGRGLHHAGLTAKSLGVRMSAGGKAEPLVSGFEEAPTTRGVSRPPGFDELVLQILLEDKALDLSSVRMLHTARVSAGASCAEYATEIMRLLDAGALRIDGAPLRTVQPLPATQPETSVSSTASTPSPEAPVSLRMRLTALLAPVSIAILAFAAPWVRVEIDGEPYLGFSLARTIVDTPSREIVTEIPSDNPVWAIAIAVIAGVLGLRAVVARDSETAGFRIAGGGLILTALVVGAWLGRSDWTSSDRFHIRPQGGLVQGVTMHMAWGYWLALAIAIASVILAIVVGAADEIRDESRRSRS